MLRKKCLPATCLVVCCMMIAVTSALLSPSTAYAASRQVHTTPCKIDGTPIEKSPVAGINPTEALKQANQPLEQVGEVDLMWSSICQTNWAVFYQRVMNPNIVFKSVAVYLYSQGGGRQQNTACTVIQASCETDALVLPFIKAQAVASCVVYDSTKALSITWMTYGIASQYPSQ